MTAPVAAERRFGLTVKPAPSLVPMTALTSEPGPSPSAA